MENEKDLKNLRALLKVLSECETENEFKRECQIALAWLALRCIANRESTVDEIAPTILEAIEKFFDWDIPTMDEIAKESEND